MLLRSMVTPAPSSASASARRRSARPEGNSGRSPTGNSRCSGTWVQPQARRGEGPGSRVALRGKTNAWRRGANQLVEPDCGAGQLMRIRNLKHSHPALGLLLLFVVFTTACNIVSGPPSFVSPLYVANFGSNSILIYAPFPKGNAGPANTIIGAATGLSGPSGITLNAAGQIFVANSSVNSITVYPLGANGAAAPIRTIIGALTLLDNPQGIALDTAGNLYVANDGATTSSITVYAPGAGGTPGTPAANVPPIRTISGALTLLDNPQGVIVDAMGILYVADAGAMTSSITVYASGAGGAPGTPATNIPPIRTISGSGTGLDNPIGVGLDTAGNLYVANAGITTSSITVYAPGASGTVPPSNTITGINTGLAGPHGVVLDPTARLYAANNSTPSITVYTPGAMGNATPIRTITGGATLLNQPLFIALRP